MPSRGVQDYEEHKKKRQEERKRKQEKIQNWCQLAGLTIIELVLCFICFLFAYFTNLTIFWPLNIGYLMLPKLPIIVALAYIGLTTTDLISWISMRPITYHAWLTVSTSGFLMFMCYAGVCFFNIVEIIGILGIISGIITALVFLVDTICCLMSLKRFPDSYWVLKRKMDKFDDCVCTGDYHPEEEKQIQRPLCRCGDNWGEPCSCDAEMVLARISSDGACGCAARTMDDEPPCPCCECRAQAQAREDLTSIATYDNELDFPRKSIITTASGRDYLVEEEADPRKSTMTQVTLIPSAPPDMWCIDGRGPSNMPMGSIGSAPQTRKSGIPTGKGDPMRKSTTSQRSTAVAMSGSPESRQPSVSRTRKSNASTKYSRSEVPTYSVYTTTVEHHNVPLKAYDFSPSALKIKDVALDIQKIHHGDCTSIKGARGVNLSEDTRSIRTFDISTDEDFAVGDYSRNKSSRVRDKTLRKKSISKDNPKSTTCTSTDYLPMQGTAASKITYENSLPGQISEKNVAVTTKIVERSHTAHSGSSSRNVSGDRLRPRTDSFPRTVIRNVSTTVRPVRTLSSVIENSHESASRSGTEVGRKPDSFPSECTITINK